MEVRQNNKLVGRLQAEVTGRDQEPGAKALAELPADGADRRGAVETGSPPLISLRPFGPENSFELPIRRRRLLAPALHLFGSGFDLAALELKEPCTQGRDETPPALVQRLDIPDLRELAQGAFDLKGLNVVRRCVGADVLFNDVPVAKGEGRFGQSGQIPVGVVLRHWLCFEFRDHALERPDREGGRARSADRNAERG